MWKLLLALSVILAPGITATPQWEPRWNYRNFRYSEQWQPNHGGDEWICRSRKSGRTVTIPDINDPRETPDPHRYYGPPGNLGPPHFHNSHGHHGGPGGLGGPGGSGGPSYPGGPYNGPPPPSDHHHRNSPYWGQWQGHHDWRNYLEPDTRDKSEHSAKPWEQGELSSGSDQLEGTTRSENNRDTLCIPVTTPEVSMHDRSGSPTAPDPESTTRDPRETNESREPTTPGQSVQSSSQSPTEEFDWNSFVIDDSTTIPSNNGGVGLIDMRINSEE